MAPRRPEQDLGAGSTRAVRFATELETRTYRNRTVLPPESAIMPQSLVFGECAFPPVSLGPAGDCPCKD